MNCSRLSASVCIWLVAASVTACFGISGKTARNKAPESTSTPISKPSEAPTLESQPTSPIHQIDFHNFAFPKLPSRKCSAKKIQLINGRYDAPEDLVPRKLPSADCWSVVLGRVDYGDVTGDGQEDAIVILYAELGGTEASQDIFIYTLREGTPTRLWKFATGDRADGGLRRVYADNGELVVELYGIGTVIGRELYGTEDVGACCPRHYTRTRYRWIQNHFLQDGKEEVLPNPSESSAIVTSNSQQ